jgi:hypothetical protein
MRLAVLLFTALAVAPTVAAPPLSAQRLERSPFASLEAGRAPPPPAARLTPSVARPSGSDPAGMVLGGLLLGAGGLFAGALVGDRFQSFPCEDCIEGAFYGALVGESLAIPLGVHLGNGRRGHAGAELAASLGIGALGVGAAALTDEWTLILAVPIAQIVSAIAIERRTARLDPNP